MLDLDTSLDKTILNRNRQASNCPMRSALLSSSPKTSRFLSRRHKDPEYLEGARLSETFFEGFSLVNAENLKKKS